MICINSKKLLELLGSFYNIWQGKGGGQEGKSKRGRGDAYKLKVIST